MGEETEDKETQQQFANKQGALIVRENHLPAELGTLPAKEHRPTENNEQRRNRQSLDDAQILRARRGHVLDLCTAVLQQGIKTGCKRGVCSAHERGKTPRSLVK